VRPAALYLARGEHEDELPRDEKKRLRRPVERFRRTHGDPGPEPTFEVQFSKLFRKDLGRFAEDADAIAESGGSDFEEAMSRARTAGERFLFVMAGLRRAYQIDEERRRKRGTFQARRRAIDAFAAFITAPRERKLRFFRRLPFGERERLAALDGYKSPTEFEASLPPQDTSKERRRSTVNQAEAAFVISATAHKLSKGAAYRLMKIAYLLAVPRGGGRAFDRAAVLRRVRCVPVSESFLIRLGVPYKKK
jgi:hypothetical protein